MMKMRSTGNGQQRSSERQGQACFQQALVDSHDPVEQRVERRRQIDLRCEISRARHRRDAARFVAQAIKGNSVVTNEVVYSTSKPAAWSFDTSALRP